MESVPVLFLVFNRPDTTKRVFDAIRQYQPQQLFIAADGPRSSRVGESELCEETRAIASAVDWDCAVKTLFRQENLGCRNAVSQGISWFFSSVDQGIILEDDCLHDASFFSFCEQMLERYSADSKVGHVSGNNFLPRDSATSGTYRFSAINHIWGWATWSRAWRLYDVDLKNRQSLSDSCLKGLLGEAQENREYWKDKFERSSSGALDTWDYQWTFTLWLNGMLSITPEKNLVTNLGFDSRATHTTASDASGANLKLESLMSVIHPSCLLADFDADMEVLKTHYGIHPAQKLTLYRKTRRTLGQFVRKVLRLERK